jgi:hypothetical protein
MECCDNVVAEACLDLNVCGVAFAKPDVETAGDVQISGRVSYEHEVNELVLEGLHVVCCIGSKSESKIEAKY